MADNQNTGSALFEQALTLEGITGPKADLARAIYGQESSSGQNTKTSNRGAVGGMQVTPRAFKDVANKDWVITDPLQNIRAGIRYSSKMLDAAGGDQSLATTGYYGGLGGMAKARKGIAVSDPENPGAPNTLEYAQQVVARIGGGRGTTGEVGSVLRAVDAAREAPLARRPGAVPTITDTGTQARANLENQQLDRPNPLEMLGAAMAGNTDWRAARVLGKLYGVADGILNGNSEDTPETGWAVPQDSYAGKTRDQVEDLAGTVNKTQHDALLTKWADDTARLKVMNDRGEGIGLGLGLGAELLSVTNMGTMGLAGMRAAKGIALAAQEGRAGSVYARAIGENLASGTAVEAALQLGEGKFDPANLLFSVAFDGAAGAVSGALIKRGVKTVSEQGAELAKVTEGALGKLDSEAVLAARAKQNLARTATQEQLGAEYSRLRTEDLKAPVTEAFTDLPPAKKLTPEPVHELELFSDKAPLSPRDRALAAHDPALTTKSVLATEPGIHLAPSVAADPLFKGIANDLAVLSDQFLPPNHSITLARAGDVPLPTGKVATPNGARMGIGPDHTVIAVNPQLNRMHTGTMIHELGHTIDAVWRDKVPDAVRKGVDDVYAKWLAGYTRPGEGLARASLAQRGPIYRIEQGFRTDLTHDRQGNARSLKEMQAIAGGQNYADGYFDSFKEFMAEQFNKHIEHVSVTGDTSVKLSDGIIKFATENMKRMVELFKRAIGLGYLAPDARMTDFFSTVQKMAKDSRATATDLGTDFSVASDHVSAFLAKPEVRRFGLEGLPLATEADRANAEHILNLHLKAEVWEKANPKDAAWDKRAQNLADNSVFNVASTGLLMLKSVSPVVRMVASQLLEDASGVAGKRSSTAAIAKVLREKFYSGNTPKDYTTMYELWRKGQGGTAIQDTFGDGALRQRFDREVATELENRRMNEGRSVSTDPTVTKAVESIHAAYERMRVDQIKTKTLGWAGLPQAEAWYMPHMMSAGKVNALTNEERQVLHSALSDQYVSIEGWDMSFADKLASKVVDTVRRRALGSFDSHIGGNSAGSAEIIEDALTSMGMSADEVRAHMATFNKGAANFTKKRTNLDLTREYKVDAGSRAQDAGQKTFTLMDIFNTDQLSLLKAQTGRVSGEVALARHGVYGKPGLGLLRTAMLYGEDGKRIVSKEDMRALEAFDQVSAEFLGSPYGTQAGKGIERAMILNVAVRMGGAVYNQFAEVINGISHVGVGAALSTIGAFPRLRKEIADKVVGKVVENSLLDSIELLGGAEFGTDAYKMIMPYDSHIQPTFAGDSLTTADKLLRGAAHLQTKLSLWSAVHSSQQRGFAEQIVAKLGRYVKEGKEDIALAQFGVDKALAGRMRMDIDKVATFAPDGKVTGFDVTKFSDPDVAEQVVQAVHRGVSQIIQDTFIGEKGKWAHDGYLRMLTQFRSFSLVSTEKQWARQRNSRGTGASLGILVGSMAAALPVYMARTYASSIGREDQQEYLDKRLSLPYMSRALLNYVALSGMAGDALDLSAALAPESFGMGAMTGGRSGSDSKFIGNLIAPAAGLVDDAFSTLQHLDDPQKVANILPFGKVPWLAPAINALVH